MDERHVDPPGRAPQCSTDGCELCHREGSVRVTPNRTALVVGGGWLRWPGDAIQVPRHIPVCGRRTLPADVPRASAMASVSLALPGCGCGCPHVPSRGRLERAARLGLVRLPGRSSTVAKHQSAGAARSAWRTSPLPIALVVAAARGVLRPGGCRGAG